MDGGVGPGRKRRRARGGAAARGTRQCQGAGPDDPHHPPTPHTHPTPSPPPRSPCHHEAVQLRARLLRQLLPRRLHRLQRARLLLQRRVGSVDARLVLRQLDRGLRGLFSNGFRTEWQQTEARVRRLLAMAQGLSARGWD
jgi:hypothetical protein